MFEIYVSYRCFGLATTTAVAPPMTKNKNEFMNLVFLVAELNEKNEKTEWKFWRIAHMSAAAAAAVVP